MAQEAVNILPILCMADCIKLDKEARVIIKEIEKEKEPNTWSYRKGYRLIHIGATIPNDYYKQIGYEYLKILGIHCNL